VQLREISVKYDRIKDFREEVGKAREEILWLKEKLREPGADEEKINQRIKEISDKLTQEQEEINEDVRKAGEKIAQQQGLTLVLIAGSILYKGEDIQLQDITQPVIELLNETYSQVYEGGGVEWFKE